MQCLFSVLWSNQENLTEKIDIASLEFDETHETLMQHILTYFLNVHKHMSRWKLYIIGKNVIDMTKMIESAWRNYFFLFFFFFEFWHFTNHCIKICHLHYLSFISFLKTTKFTHHILWEVNSLPPSKKLTIYHLIYYGIFFSFFHQ